MEEKIKIYITDSINKILLKDMERFEFYKKNREFNKNEFYNNLIISYYEQYEKDQSAIYRHIAQVIAAETDFKENKIAEMTSSILQYADLRAYNLQEEKYDVTISIKPTKASADIFFYIEDQLLQGSTLSNYFRNMFASYALQPQDRRERIIFRNSFELIEEAIRNRRKLYFTTRKNEKGHIVSPYAIANSKEELFNYLLCQYNDLPSTFRIGRMKQVKVLNEAADIKEENIAILNKMTKCGPQFAYGSRKTDELIKVRLSERGRQLFDSIYLHRPQPIKTADDIYYFDCSRTQAFQYFSRFGSNALILEPEELVGDLQRFYESAANQYRKLADRNKKEKH